MVEVLVATGVLGVAVLALWGLWEWATTDEIDLSDPYYIDPDVFHEHDIGGEG